jgi:replicative DNA helicase
VDIEKAINQQPSKLESKILKAIFKNNQAILDIIDIIDYKSFTIDEYASIYESMVEIYKYGDQLHLKMLSFG